MQSLTQRQSEWLTTLTSNLFDPKAKNQIFGPSLDYRELCFYILLYKVKKDFKLSSRKYHISVCDIGIWPSDIKINKGFLYAI